MVIDRKAIFIMLLLTFPSIAMAMDGGEQGTTSMITPTAVTPEEDGSDAVSYAMSAQEITSSELVLEDNTKGTKTDSSSVDIGPALIETVEIGGDAESTASAGNGHEELSFRHESATELAKVEHSESRLRITDKGNSYFLEDVHGNGYLHESGHVPLSSHSSSAANLSQKTIFQERFPGRLPARRDSLDPMERREARREFSRNNTRRTTNRPPGVVRLRPSGIIIGRGIK